MRLVITGPPGAGKGTQGTRVAAQFGIVHLSSGDLLRQIIASGEKSALAWAAQVITEGKMISDETANALMLREIAKPEAMNGFVLDGYPRTVSQAQTLQDFLSGRGKALNGVLALDVQETVLVERLSNRITCPHCGATYQAQALPPHIAGVCDRCGYQPLEVRPDDQPERVKVRLGLYAERTKPLLDWYAERNELRRVNGEGSEDVVFARVLAELKK